MVRRKSNQRFILSLVLRHKILKVTNEGLNNLNGSIFRSTITALSRPDTREISYAMPLSFFFFKNAVTFL